jgi:hypothetical protein
MCLVLRVEGGSLSRPTAAKGGLSVPRLTGLTHYRPEALVTCLAWKVLSQSVAVLAQHFPVISDLWWEWVGKASRKSGRGCSYGTAL